MTLFLRGPLGSASRDLIQHSSETLAGRVRLLELSPLSVLEMSQADPLGFNFEKRWFRDGFPKSYLAHTDDESWDWRSDFISSYVERDIPLMGPQVSAVTMRRGSSACPTGEPLTAWSQSRGQLQNRQELYGYPD